MIPKSGSRFSDKIMLKREILLERTAPMAKKQTDSVYRIVDVVGVSEKSWEDAGRRAVETAAGSLRDLRVAEVTKMDMRVENGKVLAFRTRRAVVQVRGVIALGVTRLGLRHSRASGNPTATPCAD